MRKGPVFLPGYPHSENSVGYVIDNVEFSRFWIVVKNYTSYLSELSK